MADAEKVQRIGLLGGTFDPVHEWHLAIAKLAEQTLSLDRVILIPAVDPPHKKSPGASYSHRVAMLEAALSCENDSSSENNSRERGSNSRSHSNRHSYSYKKFEISLIEAELSVPSYTVDTLIELKKRLGAQEFYFIIGADSLLELHHWYRYQELLRLTSFIVITRPGIAISAMHQAIERFPGPFLMPEPSKQRWIRADGTEIILIHNNISKDVSSSVIRSQLQQGLLPNSVNRHVLEYIAEHCLYQSKR